MPELLTIRDPDLSELDGSGRPVLHPARFRCLCGICSREINPGDRCVLIDSEMVCARCVSRYRPYEPRGSHP